jgi:ketosteroid isomerase-like protein
MAELKATEDAVATEQVRRVVTRYATAWAGGDFPVLRDCYHEQFTLYYAGNNPLSGVHKGKAACLAVLEEFRKRTRRKLLSVDHIMAGPERGAVFWPASSSAMTARPRTCSGCWCTQFSTTNSMNAGSTIRIRP